MHSKRWLVIGIVAACASAPSMIACGNDSFSGSSADASASETSTDGTLPDSSTLADAAVFCQPAPTLILCADFDEPDLRSALTINGFSAFFSNTATSDGGSVFRSDSGLSPPSSLASSIDALDPDASAQGQTGGALDEQSDADHFRLSMSIRFDSVGSLSGPGTLELFTFALTGTGTTTYQLIVTGGHLGIAVIAASTVVGGVDLGVVPSASEQWLPFSADITLGMGGKLTAALGGVNGATGGFTNSSQRRPTLVLGTYSPGATGAMSVSFDNVSLYADKTDAGVGVTTSDAGHD